MGNPEAEAKARQEVDDVCGVRGCVYEDMANLPYLQAVLDEALRLYPSIPIDAKFAAHDDVLPDGTLVPRGTVVVYNIYGMGRDEDIWGEDAEKFHPERWLKMRSRPSNFEYPVFNAGPRECLGRRLAQVEMLACLAMILPQLSFKLAVPAEHITPDCQLTIGMGRGLPCYVMHVGRRDHVESSSSTAGHSEGTTLSDFTGPSDSEDEMLVEPVCRARSPDLVPAAQRKDSRSARRSGRARQREKHRRRRTTPSPVGLLSR